MVYTVLAGCILFIALLLILLAGKTLFKRHWFLGWLRGMTGIVIAAIAILLVLSALDFYSYKQLGREEVIATLGFSRIESQRFKVSLVDSTGNEAYYELAGDLWELDARIIKWNTRLAALGLQPGYRLDRLSGRYYSLEDEKNAERTVYPLAPGNRVDVWQWLHTHTGASFLVDARYGSATYLPMEDGALFSVALTSSGLIARPLNERAREAIDRWQ